MRWRRCPHGRKHAGLCGWLIPFVALAATGVLGGGDTPPFNAGQSTASDDSTGLLLLTSGRIVSGHIHYVSGGYDVAQENGRMFVPGDLVQFEASDLQDAHRKIRSSMQIESAPNHITVARWCISHQLFKEAGEELRDALKLDPTREDARRMLWRVEELMNPDHRERRSSSSSPALTFDGFERPEVKSLAGLSRDSALEFTTKIQPILMNKCGNARCHGESADNEFRLTHVRIGYGNHRVQSERNLAATLNFIDVRNVDASRLLTALEDSHSETGKADFYGPAGASQRQLLRQWIRTVATELKPAAADDSEHPSTVEDADDAFISDLLRKERHDEFDPAVFNHAGPTSGDSGRKPR